MATHPTALLLIDVQESFRHRPYWSERELPAFLARTNARGVPWVATLFVAALPLVGLAWAGGDVGRIVPLLIAAAGAWLVSYMMAHLSLIVLRRRQPDAPRAVPGSRRRR